MKKYNNKNVNRKLLARIVADITSDGHLQLKGWRGLASFYSNDLVKINAINEKFVKLFGISGKVYTKNGKHKQYRIFFISKPLAKFLVKIGVPPGNKTDQVFQIPQWIMHGNKKIQSSYLRGIFSGEGSIFCTRQKNGKKRWRIGIEMYKWIKFRKQGGQYMNQIRDMLIGLGITSSPVRAGRRNLRKNDTYSIAFKIDIESHEFGKFYKEIGFDDDKKTDKLLKAIAGAQA
jgi:intein/homing endonuclease